MEGRLDKAELSVEIDNLREELQKVKEEKSAKEVVKVEETEEKKEEVPASTAEPEKPIESQILNESIKEIIKVTDQGLKRKVFELKTEVDNLRSKIDVFSFNNH